MFIPVAAFEALNALQADMRDRAVEETRARSRAFDETKARVSAERRFPSFASPRNAASGGLRQQLDKKDGLEREAGQARLDSLRLFVHGIGAWSEPPVASQSETYGLLAEWGLPTHMARLWIDSAAPRLSPALDGEIVLEYEQDLGIVTCEMWADGKRLFGLDDWVG